MQKRLKRKGFSRNMFETPNDFVERISMGDNDLSKNVDSFTKNYIALKYKKTSELKTKKYLIKNMKDALRAI